MSLIKVPGHPKALVPIQNQHEATASFQDSTRRLDRAQVTVQIAEFSGPLWEGWAFFTYKNTVCLNNKSKENTSLVGGFSPTHSKKYARQNGFIFPNFRGENKEYLKPPPRSYIEGSQSRHCVQKFKDKSFQVRNYHLSPKV